MAYERTVAPLERRQTRLTQTLELLLSIDPLHVYGTRPLNRYGCCGDASVAEIGSSVRGIVSRKVPRKRLTHPA